MTNPANAYAYPLAPGALVAGKYRVERVLGQGGMGMVLAAQHVTLGTPVALKVLLPLMQQHQEVLDRFLREAQAAANLRGDHIARVIDVGTVADGSPYMVMEYLNGTDLAGLLEQRGPLPVGDVVDYVLQAIEAIAEAHSIGIVHRDLKPANLFLTQRPGGVAWIKVLDFGISKLVSPGEERKDLTRTTTSLGSPLYMSPEQLRSARSVDTRADIWALGVILFELLTGECPFEGDSVPALSLTIALEPPRSLRGLRPDVPAELEAVVLRCLQKERDARFPDVAQLARALLPHGVSRAGRAAAENAIRILNANAEDPLPASQALATQAAPAPQQSTNLTFSATQTRRNTPAIALGLVLFLVIAAGMLGAAVWLLRSRLWSEPSAPDVAAAADVTSSSTATAYAPALGAPSAAAPASSSAPPVVASAVPPAVSSTGGHAVAAPPKPHNPGRTPPAPQKPPPASTPKGGNPDTAIDSRH
jgi:serine/threonine-protein kinase